VRTRGQPGSRALDDASSSSKGLFIKNQILALRGFEWVTRDPTAPGVASPNMAADLSVRDLCASAFSVTLRDQFSIDPSIAASDLPLNGSRRGRRGAEHAEEQPETHGSSGLSECESRPKGPLGCLTADGRCHAAAKRKRAEQPRAVGPRITHTKAQGARIGRPQGVSVGSARLPEQVAPASSKA